VGTPKFLEFLEQHCHDGPGLDIGIFHRFARGADHVANGDVGEQGPTLGLVEPATFQAIPHRL